MEATLLPFQLGSWGHRPIQRGAKAYLQSKHMLPALAKQGQVACDIRLLLGFSAGQQCMVLMVSDKPSLILSIYQGHAIVR